MSYLDVFKLIQWILLFQRSISENSLVAMDFSGQKTRVIENPSEVLSVAVEEGLSWRVSLLYFEDIETCVNLA